jgi:hypothetical protein
LLRNPFSDLQFAARDGRLLVLTAARRDDPGGPALVQSIDDALAPRPPADQEIVPIPDADLTRWTRAAGPAAPPTRETMTADDRRWLWLAALALLAVEWRMRRSRPAPDSVAAAPDPGATRAA